MIEFLGAPVLVEPGPRAREAEARWEAELSVRQRRLLVGEVNAGLLLSRGRALEVTLELDGVPWDDGAAVRFEGDAEGEPVARVVRLESDDAPPAPPTPRQRVERALPLSYDRLRALLLAGRASRPLVPDDGSVARRIADAAPPRAGAPASVLVGMHWLDVGGAETWALRTVRLVAEAGLLPVVVVDRASSHPLVADELFGRALFLSVVGMDEAEGDEIVRGLAERLDLRGVLVHHNRWLYGRLPWLGAQRPGAPVIDSLHIVEDGEGGFPAFAVRADAWVAQHHVISPALEAWFVEKHGVDPAKVVMAPLTTLTVDADAALAERDPRRPFTIAYIGRLARQKRPYLFVRLVGRLRRAGVPVRAIMHGDGELEGLTRGLMRRRRVTDAIELRPHTRPVADTLREADLLVISSLNEGLTLTTFEAVAAGVPVVSADVGSQRSVVAPAALVPAPARAFLREATRVIRGLVGSEDARRAVWEDERRRVAELSAHQDATSWMREVIARWAA